MKTTPRHPARKSAWAGLLAFASLVLALPAAATAPRTFLVAPSHYVQLRAEIAPGLKDPGLAVTLAAVRADAEAKMKAGPWSVMDKPDRLIGPSGDKHDYVSLSRYWWPGPDGTYVWRDGQINPDMISPDESALADLMVTVRTLANAGYFLGEDRYLARAALLIRRWFIDPATRMNPNLNFAAGIPGKTTGRGIGLHRMKWLPMFVDVLGLVGTSPSWSAADEAGMRDWMRRYLRWATTSKLGLDEKDEPNNHAVYYGAHILAAALYVEDQANIEEFSQRYFQHQIINQLRPDGELPEEMKRPRPYNYAIYTMTAFCYYAELARGLGLDYYHFKGPQGQSIARAFAWLIPFLKGDVKSPKQLCPSSSAKAVSW
ncbi:MAG: alginate lyase family protein [Opitutaceae bacterium]|nr:alginate lyase family protein [Opitutaceae bacterium]